MNSKSDFQATVAILPDASLVQTRSVPSYDFLADQIGASLLDDEAFINALTSRIVTASFVAQIARTTAHKPSDPFDSVYISDLKPDEVSEQTIKDIENVGGITDVSASIVFNDGLD